MIYTIWAQAEISKPVHNQYQLQEMFFKLTTNLEALFNWLGCNCYVSFIRYNSIFGNVQFRRIWYHLRLVLHFQPSLQYQFLINYKNFLQIADPSNYGRYLICWMFVTNTSSQATFQHEFNVWNVIFEVACR